MVRRMLARRGPWLALSGLVGAGFVAAGLATAGDLVVQLWGGVMVVLAAGLLRARPGDRGGSGDAGEAGDAGRPRHSRS